MYTNKKIQCVICVIADYEEMGILENCVRSMKVAKMFMGAAIVANKLTIYQYILENFTLKRNRISYNLNVKCN